MTDGGMLELWQDYHLTARTVEHLAMFSVALLLSMIIGFAVGVFLSRRRRFAGVSFAALNTLETFPDLALLVVLIPLLGIGAVPTIAACVLYSVLPIARNTYTGLTSVSAGHVNAAESIGLTEGEVLVHIRVPLALPMLAGGVRIAVVFTMGIVTLGGLVGAGGLGVPLQTGIFNNMPDLILLSGAWVGLLAVLFDGVAAVVERRLTRRYGQW
ncbi:osmoprotectant transport system permease protein [Methanofollis sp. W23]|uniref:ABC transporter permease n=1 Tax=Methanofollis sp. W23 TaxID=2817849 RepID=UPI001AE57220|nr:ABC transporter permease [Methanofollis sp. W23]MBP2144923.1 osmoprotectant transport system permease protein [Methanofollis sp. W23]